MCWRAGCKRRLSRSGRQARRLYSRATFLKSASKSVLTNSIFYACRLVETPPKRISLTRLWRTLRCSDAKLARKWLSSTERRKSLLKFPALINATPCCAIGCFLPAWRCRRRYWSFSESSSEMSRITFHGKALTLATHLCCWDRELRNSTAADQRNLHS